MDEQGHWRIFICALCASVAAPKILCALCVSVAIVFAPSVAGASQLKRKNVLA